MSFDPATLPTMKLQEAPDLWEHAVDPKASAVLALFMRDPNQGLCLLFTRRASEMRSHAGQVGFPGGRRESTDIDPSATALREAWEEIDLDPESVTVIGMLNTLRSLDSRPVIPIVAYTEQYLPDLKPNPSEVAEIFLVPWEKLTAEHRTILKFNIFGRWRETPFYAANGHHIWGLTAWMLDFMELVER